MWLKISSTVIAGALVVSAAEDPALLPGPDGFVHLSRPDQVHLPASRLGLRRPVLLVVDPARLDAPLRAEPGLPADPDGMLFPHLYGPLPTSAFPSGHIAATACLYTAIAVLVVPRSRGWLRWLSLAAVAVMPAGVALSRMYRGMHHPTDLLGAVLLTTLWILLLVAEAAGPARIPRTEPAPAPA